MHGETVKILSSFLNKNENVGMSEWVSESQQKNLMLTDVICRATNFLNIRKLIPLLLRKTKFDSGNYNFLFQIP
jgi:hypothetical protein